MDNYKVLESFDFVDRNNEDEVVFIIAKVKTLGKGFAEEMWICIIENEVVFHRPNGTGFQYAENAFAYGFERHTKKDS